MLYTYDYEPTPIETEIFLTDEPMRLLLQQIKTQFENPSNNNKIDYVDSFINSYRASVDQIETDDDENDLDRLIREFMSKMMEFFRAYLDVEFVDASNLDYSTLLDRIHMTYRYFILNIKHNFSAYCGNILDRNMDKYVNMLESTNNLTESNYKVNLSDENLSIILSNMYTIIDDIISSMNGSIDEFIRYSDYNNPRLETQIVDDLFDNFQLVGNFLEKYSMCVDTGLKKEIELKLKKELLHRYREQNKE
jgi:hypothetical protein|nr:MAG TPA: hypothetical protein [Caudoviricetes sp.]